MDKAYVDFHKVRITEMTKNLSPKDIYSLDYDSLQYDKEKQQYSCYGYVIKKFSNVYYILEEGSKNGNVDLDYKLTFDNIDGVNGFIKTMYKVYHKMIMPK